MHGGGQEFESPQLHHKFKSVPGDLLLCGKPLIVPNRSGDHLLDLVKGFILQLRIEGYSSRTIKTYQPNLKNFTDYLSDRDIVSVAP